MTVRLLDLEPDTVGWRDGNGLQRISFLCPACRMLRCQISIWQAPHAELIHQSPDNGEWREKVWHVASVGRAFDGLSLTPSVATSPHKRGNGQCPGWHGFITNGEVT